ncbi:beta-N-acetylglucosaminidase domain-containing protein [Allohahella marinimesophila]|uniref:Beta-N-acetylglucosaminidase domain-containing protein n=1 Tax=Allohahella marinimesophila TaxID=1054972 RepID=A0ABP7PFT5_9GAMM
MTVELGIIEGFYGKPWRWQERQALVSFLAPHGYRFYLYAPKTDAYLRRRWQETHPDDALRSLTAFADHCRGLGVRFGVGLSPYELYADFSSQSQAALATKLDRLVDLGIDDLAILFDDMPSAQPDLAARQAEIMHWVQARVPQLRLLFCPSYYSDDPVLDRVFGQRPDGYLEALGALLDPAIEVFWTGEEVCSREISPGHLRRVSAQLARKPFLWDNYPVNDGQRMSQFLHLRGVTGRPAANAEMIVAHGINPALQSTLTRIPALTLAESYQQGQDYQYAAAFSRAAKLVAGEPLASQLQRDLISLNDSGLDRIGEDRLRTLRDTYAATDHPAAREVLDWLDGGYRISDDLVQTQ